jgi:hypothetical protein
MLAKHGGGRAVAIARYLQGVAATLWRRDLVEIWYRQVPDEQPSMRGPFYTLSLSGWNLASRFLDDRKGVVAPVAQPARRPRRPAMHIVDYSPTRPGQCFQGDVSIVPIPLDLAVATCEEIPPEAGRLILQAGEATGHHHAIYLLANVPRFHDEAMARDMFADTKGASAKLYRDPTVAPELVRRGILTRSDLATSCLIVEGGPVVIYHEEHGGIRVPPGKYLIGGQLESAGAEERRVRD